MALNPNLPDLSHIGNKYRERTKETKNQNLSKKYKDKAESRLTHNVYREAVVSVLSRLESYEGMKRKDIKEAVTNYVWQEDIPHNKYAFSKALNFLLSKNKIQVKEHNGQKYYRLKTI